MKGEGDVVSGLKEWADFLGAGLLVYWGNGPPTSQSRFARYGGRAVGDPDLGAPSVYPGAVVSFWQPIFTLQQPYWIGFLVHPSSASMLAWLRRSASERKAFEGRSFLGLEH